MTTPHDRIPWGAVGAIALIIAVECFVGRFWQVFNDPVSLSWHYSTEVVRSESSSCELLCLGDSLIKHGLVPGVIEEETGRPAVNVSAARAPALLTYFLLRRALDAGARPKAIIINAKPAVLLAGPEFNARYWQEVLTPRECVELAEMGGGGSFVLSTIVGRLLPSLRSRLEVRSNLMAACRGDTEPIATINRVLLRNWTVNRGANIAPGITPRRDETGLDLEQRLHPGIFHVDRSNQAGLERLMRLADEHDIRVFWLLPPISPELQSRRDQSGAEASHDRFVRSFLVRYPRLLTVLDARRGGYPAELFIDHTHLNVHGAIALSHAVAAAIKPTLASPISSGTPNWMELGFSADQSPRSTIAIEDLEQSRKVLGLSKSAFITAR